MRAAIDKITRQSRGRVSARVEQVQISGLRPYENNARTHSPKQIRQIARSIGTFGFVNPVLIDSDEQIICGHGRVAGAQLLGLATVPALRIEHLSSEELRAYALADNRLAEGAGWDKETLAIELEGLADLNFDVEVTGFDIPEIEMIFDSVNPQAANAEDDKFPDLMPNNVVTKQGDLWVLGDHTLAISIDTAMKGNELADYSVATVWLCRRDNCFLLDLWRERVDYPHLKRAVSQLRDKYPNAILVIEDKGSGTSLIQDLRAVNISAIGINPEGDKLTRVAKVSAQFEAGSVFFPKNAPWLSSLKAELLGFPNVKHDDQVDSVTQALLWNGKRRASQIPWVSPVIITTPRRYYGEHPGY